jgi:hypothetical protein
MPETSALDYLCFKNPAWFARLALGFVPDPHQHALLASSHPRRLLCCSRQWGKSTLAAILAVHHLLYGPPASLTLLIAPALRQSLELLRKIHLFLARLGLSPRSGGHPQSLALPNGARVVALPARDATTRGFSAVSLLILDEAARLPDDVYFAFRPVLAVSAGQLLALSTPAGQRGFFFEAAHDPSGLWQARFVPAHECPRIPASFLDEERRALSDWWFRQEYLCEFVPLAAGLFPPRALDHLLTDDAEPL